MSDTPRIEQHIHSGDASTRLHLLGRWTAAQLSREGVLIQLLAQLKATPDANMRWDLRLMLRLDHIGAQLLWNHWGHWFRRSSRFVVESRRAVK